jgi:shikimate dehydrogenase
VKHYGLIGYPLSHSFSKKFFTEKFLKENIADHVYDLYPIQNIEALNELVKNNPQLYGINVTIPYKEQVLAFLNEKDKVVAEAGACNCIKINKGKLKGFNTDVVGFTLSLKQYLLPTHTKALILGTGGAAKAVAYSLNKLGITYKLVSRSANSKNIITYDILDENIIQSHTLIINTTPLGMSPNIHTVAAIPFKFITPKHYLFDVVYNPGETLFLQKGKERGAVIKNGYDMLEIQALESWRIWNDELL